MERFNRDYVSERNMEQNQKWGMYGISHGLQRKVGELIERTILIVGTSHGMYQARGKDKAQTGAE